jgi:hypothetical protein
LALDLFGITDEIALRAASSISLDISSESEDILDVSSKTRYSPINREFYLAKGTEKFILGRYLLSGILLILLSLRPWGVAARPAILENRGGKSHFCDYFIIHARYVYLSYYRKCRACNSLHFLLVMFFVRSIVS